MRWCCVYFGYIIILYSERYISYNRWLIGVQFKVKQNNDIANFVLLHYVRSLSYTCVKLIKVKFLVITVSFHIDTMK